MARIPDTLIERLKAHVPVQKLAQACGVVFNRRGADLVARCPFHEDRTPSLVLTPATNLWHCFGCQAGGTVIDWVMRTQGVSFRHAVELLQSSHALPVTAAEAFPLAASVAGLMPAKRSRTKKPLEPQAQDAQLLGQAIEYYHQVLLHSPEALDYLKRRGIGNEEAIRTFKLGFANGTLGYQLPGVAGPQMRERLQRLGLVRQSGHEHFNGSIVIPVIDASAAVTEVYGRKINDNLRPGTPTHLYLPGPHRGVWNATTLSAARHCAPEMVAVCDVILCEALIDALTFWCAGYRKGS